MKTAWYLSFKEIRRRPGRFLGQVAVSAAILVAMILLLLYTEAAWRASVMPETEDNYHFTIEGLTDGQKQAVVEEPWVQVCYEELSYREDGSLSQNLFHVRVVWDEIPKWSAHAIDLFDRLELWDTEPYSGRYKSYYNDVFNNVTKKNYGATEVAGIPVTTLAHKGAKSGIMSQVAANTPYINDTLNSYIVQPSFFAYLTLFSLFFAAAIAILSSERYKRNLREYGTLRALGLTEGQVATMHTTETLLATLFAIPPAVAIAYYGVKLYIRLTASMVTDDVYLTLLDTPPVAVVLWVALFLTIASVLGSVAICMIHRRDPVMAQLRGEGAYQVSFVSKTSSAFEAAPGFADYNRLYVIRTRRTRILSAAVIVIMLPLPMFYLSMLAKSLLGLPASGQVVEALYLCFQSLFIFITAITVTVCSSAGAANERHREFGILRALGMTRRNINGVARSLATVEGVIISLLAVVLFAFLSDARLQSTALRVSTGKSMGELLILGLAAFLSAAVFVFPSVFGGLSLSLFRFHRRSVIHSLRTDL